jgi:hypothetical protein
MALVSIAWPTHCPLTTRPQAQRYPDIVCLHGRDACKRLNLYGLCGSTLQTSPLWIEHVAEELVCLGGRQWYNQPKISTLYNMLPPDHTIRFQYGVAAFSGDLVISVAGWQL